MRTVILSEETLSIHDLTRRSTEKLFLLTFLVILSIHDLTRRSTLERRRMLFPCDLSIHDLTRRSTAVPASEAPSLCFQFTTSQGGRHNSMYYWNLWGLSIHDLTRSATQLHVLLDLLGTFNSRPLKEVDGNLLQYYSKYLRYFLHFV